MPSYTTHIPTSLVDVLTWRAKNQPDQLAYRFLLDGEHEEVILNYEQLDRRARAIAALLQSSVRAGDRALLLFQPGLDFITAYFGCLYSKTVAIPASAPHPARIEISLPIIRRIAADAEATAVLLSSKLFDEINSRISITTDFGNIKFLITDNDEINRLAEQWRQPEIGSKDIAFLQYTSGSTTTPRGVVISHANLTSNLRLIEKCFGVSEEDHGVMWLPPYHDMGLIGGILQPIYSGAPFTLMSHLIFLQRPFRWLQTISRYKATISGGPNFAYDLCARKIKPEQRELVDLSTWKVAFNGAEPISHETLDRFADYFAPCGFRREAFVPCYGLAESTLFVAGGPGGRPPVMRHFLSKGLEQNRAIVSSEKTQDTRTLVSCGQINTEQIVKIVNAETQHLCRSSEIGEIWVKGPGVASAYWNKTDETEFTFGAVLSDSDEGPFLRTGDLGFLHDGELYVTGRLKNLIISEGKNHYSHDIERTVEASHSAIRPAGCAAISISNFVRERIIIIAEVDHKLNVKAEDVISAIRKAVAVHHDLQVDDVRLTVAGAIPRTTSGKIRHHLCKTSYITGNLKEISLT